MNLLSWLSWLSYFEAPAEINPATGLPMISGAGNLDVNGNPYGLDLHAHNRHEDPFDHLHTAWSDPFDHGSGFDHGSIGSGFDSFGGGFGNPWD